MEHVLAAEKFSELAIPQLSDLDCGSTIWGQFATAWIRCTNPNSSALKSIKLGSEVILYRLGRGGICVGFGAIGEAQYRPPRGPSGMWSYIPQIGIDQRYHRFPPDVSPEQRISSQILSDLMSRAVDHGHGQLLLQVHKDNAGAIRLYTRAGFTDIGKPNSKGYQRMSVRLPLREPD